MAHRLSMVMASVGSAAPTRRHDLRSETVPVIAVAHPAAMEAFALTFVSLAARFARHHRWRG